MNLVVLFLTILFTLFGTFTCAVLPTSSNLTKSNESNGAQELVSSSSLLDEQKLNGDLDDHAGDHDHVQRVVGRKGVNNTEDIEKVPTDEHPSHSISADRASTTITKDNESQTNITSELSSPAKDNITNSSTASTNTSDRYSPSVSKSTETSASHTSSSKMSKSENTSTSTNTSKSSVTKSTESTSSKSSSFNKKPLVTYSVEDDPSLLNVPRVRQLISPLTPLDVKAEAANSAYLPPSSDFVLDRMQSKRELYIFPLVVLIFLVPMVLGIGIIVLRRVRDYWSTRHYRRMDFLVDGMYNT
ncbi:putative GPI-anchored protein pfl2 [Bradysia coprophila]|uniref:putative GPI-anchored protein pfl2 n=1 Tax=Bradysia coprophila TaxID=38358 RepID=UPI00187D93DC|nr:putative GPI-anchored protein pfl2 [Bradysia coprophila]